MSFKKKRVDFTKFQNNQARILSPLEVGEELRPPYTFFAFVV